MRVFGNNDMVRNVMSKVTQSEDEPIVHSMITRSLETAQKRIEGFNFDARKRILAYDDVLNHQRQSIYERRRKYLRGERDAINAFITDLVATDETLDDTIAKKKEVMGEEEFYGVMRRLLLHTIDFYWLEHLETMEYLRSSVNLRAYGQRDPLIEYRKEGLHMFRSLEMGVVEHVAGAVPEMDAGAFANEENRMRQESARAQQAATRTTTGGTAPPLVRAEVKIGRNELVTVTNGTDTKEMKFKKAEPLLAEGWKVVSKS
jgi:preprotein translocase subunit SecA